jgi:hypothetical protein
MVTDILPNNAIQLKKNHSGSPNCVFSKESIEAGTYNLVFRQDINSYTISVWMQPEYALQLAGLLEFVAENPLYSQETGSIDLLESGSIRYGTVGGASQTCIVSKEEISGSHGVTLSDSQLGNGANVWIENKNGKLKQVSDALRTVPDALEEIKSNS